MGELNDDLRILYNGFELSPIDTDSLVVERVLDTGILSSSCMDKIINAIQPMKFEQENGIVEISISVERVEILIHAFVLIEEGMHILLALNTFSYDDVEYKMLDKQWEILSSALEENITN